MAELIDDLIEIKDLIVKASAKHKLKQLRITISNATVVRITFEVNEIHIDLSTTNNGYGFDVNSPDVDQQIRDSFKQKIAEYREEARAQHVVSSKTLATLAHLAPSPLMQLAKCADDSSETQET